MAAAGAPRYFLCEDFLGIVKFVDELRRLYPGEAPGAGRDEEIKELVGKPRGLKASRGGGRHFKELLTASRAARGPRTRVGRRPMG